MARTGVREGNAERVVPRQEIEIAQVLRDNRERRRLRSLLWANQHAKWLVPLPQDIEQVTTDLAASTTTVPVTTTSRNYEVGGYVRLQEINAQGQVDHWEDAVITALNGPSLDCEPTVYTYTAYRTFAMPSKRALLQPSVQAQGETDSVERLTVTARFLPEDEPAVPNRITVWHPTLKYRDYEMFDGQVWQSNDWSEARDYQIERILDEIDFDTGVFSVDADTAGAEESFTYRMVLQGHDNIARFLGWFYERAGSLTPLWVPSTQDDLAIVSASGIDLTVEDTNYSDNFALAESRRDLAFVYYDGSIITRRVVAFSGTINETLTLDVAVPTLTNLRFISLLKFCHIEADQLELAWETNEVAVVVWRFKELLQTPEGTGRSSLSPSVSASPSASPSASTSPSSSASPST